MSLTKSIAKNTIIHTLGKFGGSAIGVLIVALITRYLGAEGYGRYATIFAYLFFFSILSDLGLYVVGLNEFSKTGIDQKKIFGNVWTLRFFSSLIMMIFADLVIWFFPYPIEIKFGSVILSVFVLCQLSDQITISLFQQKMVTKYIAVSEIIGKLISLGGIFLAVKFNMGFYWMLIPSVFGTIFIFLSNLIKAKKIFPFDFCFDFDIWKDILKKSWPVATYMVFSMIYFKADTIILSLYRPASEVGIYGAPYRLLEALIAFPAIFMGLISPHLSKAWSEKNLVDFKNIFQRAFDALSVIIWLMIFLVFSLSTPIMNLIAGKEFLESSGILKILIIATGIIFWAHLATFSVVAVNAQKKMMKFYFFAAAMALALYFLFIPKFSYWAAATITVLVELFILIAAYIMVKKTADLKVNFNIFFKAFFSGMVMTAVICLTGFGLFANVIVAIAVYALMLYLLGVLRKDLLKV
jgi:O-antigen/teichoic acid export membrane protein